MLNQYRTPTGLINQGCILFLRFPEKKPTFLAIRILQKAFILFHKRAEKKPWQDLKN